MVVYQVVCPKLGSSIWSTCYFTPHSNVFALWKSQTREEIGQKWAKMVQNPHILYRVNFSFMFYIWLVGGRGDIFWNKWIRTTYVQYLFYIIWYKIFPFHNSDFLNTTIIYPFSERSSKNSISGLFFSQNYGSQCIYHWTFWMFRGVT